MRFDAASRRPLGEARGPAAAYANQYAAGAATVAAAPPQAWQHCRPPSPAPPSPSAPPTPSQQPPPPPSAHSAVPQLKSRATASPGRAGDVVGIGVVLGVNGHGEIVVEDLAAGWPAARSASLARGDVLLAVDGSPLSMLPASPADAGGAATLAQRLAAVRRIIVGPRDSVVTLTVRHTGGRTEDVEIRRQSGPPREQDSLPQHDAVRARETDSRNKAAPPALARHDIENLTPNKRTIEAGPGGVQQQRPAAAHVGGQHAMSSNQRPDAAAASAVLENSAGARMGAPTADWSNKLLQREDTVRKLIDSFHIDHVDVDALPGPPPALHKGIYDEGAFDDSAVSLMARHNQHAQTVQQQQQLQVLVARSPAERALAPAPALQQFHKLSHTLPHTSSTNLYGSTSGASRASSHDDPQSQQPSFQPQQAQAMYEHRAERMDELSFVRGDILSIIGRGDDEGWLLARNSRMQTGLVPHNYIRMLPLPAAPVTSRSPGAAPAIPRYSSSSSSVVSSATTANQSVDGGHAVTVKAKPTVITPGAADAASGEHSPGNLTWLEKLGDASAVAAAAAAAAAHQQGTHAQPGQAYQYWTSARSPSPAGNVNADAELSMRPGAQHASSPGVLSRHSPSPLRAHAGSAGASANGKRAAENQLGHSREAAHGPKPATLPLLLQPLAYSPASHARASSNDAAAYSASGGEASAAGPAASMPSSARAYPLNLISANQGPDLLHQARSGAAADARCQQTSSSDKADGPCQVIRADLVQEQTLSRVQAGTRPASPHLVSGDQNAQVEDKWQQVMGLIHSQHAKPGGSGSDSTVNGKASEVSRPRGLLNFAPYELQGALAGTACGSQQPPASIAFSSHDHRPATVAKALWAAGGGGGGQESSLSTLSSAQAAKGDEAQSVMSPCHPTSAACELSSSPPLSITSASASSLSPRPNAANEGADTQQWYPSAASPTHQQGGSGSSADPARQEGGAGMLHHASPEAKSMAKGGASASTQRHLSIALDKLTSAAASHPHTSPPLEPAVSYRDSSSDRDPENRSPRTQHSDDSFCTPVKGSCDDGSRRVREQHDGAAGHADQALRSSPAQHSLRFCPSARASVSASASLRLRLSVVCRGDDVLVVSSPLSHSLVISAHARARAHTRTRTHLTPTQPRTDPPVHPQPSHRGILPLCGPRTRRV